MEPFIHTTAEYPMQKLSMDLFQAGGQHYLIIVDRFSGYPFLARLSKLATTAVLESLHPILLTFGFPESIRSDGGPQFRGEFRNYCKENGIQHETSSPYHPQSNGHAEAAVKNIKHLLLKVPKQEFQAAFSTWKNTAKANSPSPNELFFRRRVRLQMPIMPSLLSEMPDFSHSNQNHETDNEENGLRKELRPLSVGTKVWIQSPHTSRWDEKAVFIDISDTKHSYTLKTDKGVTTTRNRRYLKARYV